MSVWQPGNWQDNVWLDSTTSVSVVVGTFGGKKRQTDPIITKKEHFSKETLRLIEKYLELELKN